MEVTRRKFINRAMTNTIATALSAGYVVAQDSQSGSVAPPTNRKPKQVPLSADEAKAMGKVTLLFGPERAGSCHQQRQLDAEKS